MVGVCADTRYWSLKQAPVAMFFQPYLQSGNLDGGASYEVRTRMNAASLAPELRRAVQSMDQDLPLMDLRTQREQMDATMQRERIVAALTAGFGVLALALACVGVYGVMAYSVARRTMRLACGWPWARGRGRCWAWCCVRRHGWARRALAQGWRWRLC